MRVQLSMAADSSHAERGPTVMPPSTARNWPVTKRLRSLAKYATALPMSSGEPAMRIGCPPCAYPLMSRARLSASAIDSPMARPKIEVGIRPGQIAFTRIASLASAAAATRDRWMTAPFATE
jgi:hypothetical protein